MKKVIFRTKVNPEVKFEAPFSGDWLAVLTSIFSSYEIDSKWADLQPLVDGEKDYYDCMSWSVSVTDE